MSRVSAVAERLRVRVLDGRLRPGEQLVPAVLARELGASAGGLREAQRLLEGRGLLVADPSGGMHVARPDDADVRAVLETRCALEPALAERAARRRADGELDEASAAALVAWARSPAEADPLARLFAARTFHLAVSRLGGNHVAQQALDRLWDQLLLAAQESDARAARFAGTPEVRTALADAVAAGDPPAAAALARAAASAPLGDGA